MLLSRRGILSAAALAALAGAGAPLVSSPAAAAHLSEVSAAEALSSGSMPAYVDESYGSYGSVPAQQHSVSDLEVPQVIGVDADDDGIDLPDFLR